MTAVDHRAFVTLYVTNVENGDVATSKKPVDKGAVVRLQLLTILGVQPAVLVRVWPSFVAKADMCRDAIVRAIAGTTDEPPRRRESE